MTEFEIAKMVLLPGDILVVKVERPMTKEQASEIKANFERMLPSGVKAMVIGPEISVSILTKEDIESRIAA